MKSLDSAYTLLDEIVNATTAVNDDFGVQEMLVDSTVASIEIIVKYHRRVVPKVHDILAAYNAAKVDLEVAKKELSLKENELERIRNCSKCVKLEKDLALMKKKSAVNEGRIKTIAKFLARDLPCTEDVDCDATVDGSVAKAYNLVSQMLGCNPVPSSGGSDELGSSGGTNRTHTHTNDSCTVEESVCEEDYKDSVILYNAEGAKENEEFPKTPKKRTRAYDGWKSPVLGKIKKTLMNNNKVESPSGDESGQPPERTDNASPLCIPPSPGNEASHVSVLSPRFKTTPKKVKPSKSSPRKSPWKSPRKSPRKLPTKRKADFWELKTSHGAIADENLLGKDGKKLKQSRLAFGRLPEMTDLCSLNDFNGGIRRSQTSTQVTAKGSEADAPKETPFVAPLARAKKQERSPPKRNVKMDEDIILDSPHATKAKSKPKSRVFQKLSLDGRGLKRSTTDPVAKCESKEDDEDDDFRLLDSSFDQVPKKPILSPKFKYREGPVRKKDERKKLEGWDCESCKKYFDACGEMPESERKKYINKCSRHRDKHPIRANTPPGFWDADFPDTMQLEALNATHTDVLFKKNAKS